MAWYGVATSIQRTQNSFGPLNTSVASLIEGTSSFMREKAGLFFLGPKTRVQPPFRGFALKS